MNILNNGKIKKGKVTITITIGIMCFILTMIIFIQINTIRQTNVNELEIMREDELKAEITTLKTRTNEVETKILDTNNRIAEYEEAINAGQEASDLLASELKESEDLLGKTTVTGEGVIITLSSDTMRVGSDDLLELVNLLKDAGAEAISINDKRLIYKSYISYINEGNFITVNGNRIVEPYVVKAIGNTTHLESSVSQKKYGYIDTKVSAGKNVTLEKSNEIIIYAYDGELDFDYVKEEEQI